MTVTKSNEPHAPWVDLCLIRHSPVIVSMAVTFTANNSERIRRSSVFPHRHGCPTQESTSALADVPRWDAQ
eukprot:6490739-Amphidinium_carterae.2